MPRLGAIQCLSRATGKNHQHRLGQPQIRLRHHFERPVNFMRSLTPSLDFVNRLEQLTYLLFKSSIFERSSVFQVAVHDTIHFSRQQHRLHILKCLQIGAQPQGCQSWREFRSYFQILRVRT